MAARAQRRRMMVLALAAALIAPAHASAEKPRVLGGVKSVKEIRWQDVVRQELEVGCGAASLATIMSYYFGFPASEQEMADALLAEAVADGQGQLVQVLGFSMGHIKRVAEKGGLVARGFRVPIEHLDRIRIPVIARVSIRGYDHFLVLKGAQNGRVFVADPAFGNGSYRLAAFKKIWSGVMLGFVRRGVNPQDHLLAVEASDDVGDTWERVTQQTLGSVAGLTQLSPTVSFSFQRLPAITQFVPGLESVFPKFLSTVTEF